MRLLGSRCQALAGRAAVVQLVFFGFWVMRDHYARFSLRLGFVFGGGWFGFRFGVIFRGVAAGGGDVGASDLNGLGIGRAEFAKAMELGEGAGLGSFEAGFGAFGGGDRLFHALLVDTEAIIGVAVANFTIVLGLVIEDALVGDGGGDGPGAAQAPLGDGEVLDEMEFEDGARLEGIDIILLDLFKKGHVFRAEDDSSGGKAVLYGVLRRTLFAFRSDGTAGKRAITARSLNLKF